MTLSLSCNMHCTENSKQIFSEMKLRGSIPNFYIHVSVSDLFIPTIGPPILLYCTFEPIVGIYKSFKDTVHEYGNWGTRQHSFISGNFVLNFRYSAFVVGE